MVTFEVPQPAVEVANRREADEQLFLDSLGDEPVSRGFLSNLVTQDENMREAEIMDMIDELRDDQMFNKYNDTEKELLEDDKNNITGFLFYNIAEAKWFGTYFFEGLEAWAYTVYGEDMEEVQNAHALYTAGYKQMRNETEYDKQELLGIPPEEETESNQNTANEPTQ